MKANTAVLTVFHMLILSPRGSAALPVADTFSSSVSEDNGQFIRPGRSESTNGKDGLARLYKRTELDHPNRGWNADEELANVEKRGDVALARNSGSAYSYADVEQFLRHANRARLGAQFLRPGKRSDHTLRPSDNDERMLGLLQFLRPGKRTDLFGEFLTPGKTDDSTLQELYNLLHVVQVFDDARRQEKLVREISRRLGY